MTDEHSVSYFERRAEEADQLATAAADQHADQHVRNIHIAMAARYKLLVEQAHVTDGNAEPVN